MTMLSAYAIDAPDSRTVRDWRLEIEEFHAEYCWTLDRGAIEAWPGDSASVFGFSLPFTFSIGASGGVLAGIRIATSSDRSFR